MREKVAIKYIIHRWSHGPVACLLTRPPLYGVKAPQHCRQFPVGPTLVRQNVRRHMYRLLQRLTDPQ